VEAAIFGGGMDESVREKKMAEGHDLALKAKELDPFDPRVYPPIAQYLWFRRDWDGTRRANETRLSLEPKNPMAYNNLGYTFAVNGEPKRAIELLTQAINLDPKHPNELVLLNMGWAYFMLGDNDAAVEWLQKSLEANPGFNDTYASLAMAYALKGQDASARAVAADYRRLEPGGTLSAWRKDASSFPAAYQEYFENRFVPAWRKAGLPE
jgi:adenylate cyclase